ncbi:PEP/pyruvate-binding domain-containing protein [Yoonia sp. 208BN28-4]|uniref:PEP/pyruvate-binding domain-containing protein n=1 Tax=Yoonia sp. 208BN28-4 TaxID=3126505 RepID=UPI0030B04E99
MTDMTTPALSTKSQTLDSLRGHIKQASILPQVTQTCADWIADKSSAIAQIAAQLDVSGGLIARSSAVAEDRAGASMAGAFTSIAHIQDTAALTQAIDDVIASYGDSRSAADEVLIQPMLRDVVLSGVAFTHDPTTGAPYRVISIHRGTDTSAVTAGLDDTETFVGLADAPNVPADLQPVFALLAELEGIFPDTPLDIEFAVTGEDQTLVLLQARPLALADGLTPMPAADHTALIDRIKAKVTEGMRPHLFLAGQSTVYGVMPDWNPAEIIGVRPRPLALSLYRDLVTDATWAYQRDNYGYRNLRSFPLVQTFAGHPFIDVRLSFNSFIPSDLDSGLAQKLVDYYIERLTHAPALHDKVEFEIVYSCYSLDLPERMSKLRDAGFSAAECETLGTHLRDLTNRIIEHKQGLWRLDAQKIEILRDRHQKIMSSDMSPLSRIYWLLEDCRRYGTLPFAGLARAGFIAVQMLRSFVATGIFTEDDYNAFMQSIDTVSGQFSRDLGRLDRTSFLSLYGHLRPGTYDITSPRYDEAPDLYLADRRTDTAPDATPHKPFGLSLQQMQDIRRLLKEHGLNIDVVELMEFLQAGIQLREYAKFVFSRNLSDALAILTDWGGQMGFDKEDLAHINIGLIKELHATTQDPAKLIAQSVAAGRAQYAEACSVWLPTLITTPDDVTAFKIHDSEPNFVTRNTAAGPIVSLTAGSDNHAALAGAVVFIPNADPGFDWLFAHNIGALVTAYGGVNSHMAIRAGELGLPAVIGAGEKLFAQWAKAKRIRVDCAARRIEILA